MTGVMAAGVTGAAAVSTAALRGAGGGTGAVRTSAGSVGGVRGVALSLGAESLGESGVTC
jgi:hypothetical protein